MKQPQPINSGSEWGQLKRAQSLQKNNSELEGLRRLYDSMPCISFTLNSTGVVLAVSQFGVAYLGYDAPELTQKSVTSVFYWEDRDSCQAKLTDLQQQPIQISQWEARVVRNNGDIRWVRATARVVPETQSNPIISLVCEDITAPKQMEEALRLSSARFRAAVEGSLDAFFLLQSVRDATGRIEDFTLVDLNSNGEKLISMPKEEVIGNRLCELLPFARTGGFFEKYVRVVETGVVLKEEFPVCGSGVNASWLHHQVVPLGDGVAITSRDITVGKQAEEALQDSKQRLSALAKLVEDIAANIPGCVYRCVMQPDGKMAFSFISTGLYELTGINPKEAMAHPEWMFDIVHPDDRVQFDALVKNQIESLLVPRSPISKHADRVLEPLQQEYRIISRSGQVKWLQDSARYFRNDDGDVVIDGVTLDITHRKQAEESLRESEERLRLALEAARLTSWDHNLQTGRVIVSSLNREQQPNPALKTFTITYESFLDRIHPEDRELIRQTVANAIDQDINYQVEFRSLLSNGSIVWQAGKGQVFRDATGKATRIVGITMDITLAKQAEKALRASEEQYRRIVETTTEGIWVLDAQNQTTFVNPQLAQMLGYSVHEIVGQSFLAFMDEHKRAIAELYLKRRYNGIREQHDFKFRRKDGSNLWAIVSARPIFDQAGNYLGTLKMLTDITRRKQAEEALQQQFQRERLVGATLRRIHQSLNLEEILNTTVAEVRQFLDCDRVLIFRFHEDGSGVVIVESVGADWKPMSGTVINDRYLAQIYIKLYQQGRVQAVEDIYAAGLTQCHVDLLEKFQARANLVVPIVQEEKLWGLLVAQQCGETRQWQSLEIDLLKSLSTQAAIAIHQSELYQHSQAEIIQRQQTEAALQQQFQRERLIAAIAQRIRKSLNLQEILNTTAAEVRQVLDCDRVVIFRFESDWSGKVVVESVDEHCLPILGENIYDPCFKEAYVLPYQQGRVRAIEDIYTANLDQCHINLLSKFQVRANLVVPILKREQLWGLLIAHQCSQPRQWQQFEIDLLCSLASQVVIAIQQSQLYEQAQALGLREQAINQLTQAIRSSLDLKTIFSTAVCEIGPLLQVDHAQIVQYLPERKLWLNVSEYRKSKDLPATLGVEVPDENNPIADRLKRLEIVRIDDADTCDDKLNKDFAQTFPGAWLLVPLHFGSKLWGSLCLVRDNRPYHWQESEVELICAVANQVAIAIQQAKLYEQSCTATATAIRQAHQLEQAYTTLQRTQTHLVQSEKMSSLGQLVAGVAHEINNPVNFIYANLDHASEYIEDLLGLVELYQQRYPNPSPDIQSEIATIELDFLIEDLPKLLDSMKVGAERICEIVRSLRNFSRLSEAEIKPVDIHEGLDSTLMILQSRLKAQGKHPEIQVIKEYGNLPKVECYAGQLNQVFMNVLSNAIDAIDEQNQMRSFEEINSNPSTIRVRTELFNEHQVAIRIADNGPGMTQQVKQRLFDPFFTTKPVGSGTGLGLSISYQIVVEKHGGQIHCVSELGQGTEFVIQIPLRYRIKEPQALLEELK